MSIYIVRPKSDSTIHSLSLTGKKLTPRDRFQQINEVHRLRLEDPVDQEIEKWVNETSRLNHNVKNLSSGERYKRITGARILKMPSEEADRMSEELEKVDVIPDRPLGLIQPNKALAGWKKQLVESDLWHIRAIGLKALRDKGYKNEGKGVTIAVLDTGVDETHPELRGHIDGAFKFDVKKWKAEPENPSIDTDGHGTHVAGLICGKTVGIAPRAKVISGIMLPKGHGNLSDFILALEWASTNPDIQIVNVSAGISGYVPEMRTAVADMLAVGLLPVVAIGNEGRNRTRSPGNYIEVISVGASNVQNKVSSFSGGGSLFIDSHQYKAPDLVSPGEGVYSCVAGGGYEAWDGTSMAAPIVSGIAALVLEKHPDITVTDLIDALLDNCDDLGQSSDRQGKGLIQVKNTL